MAKLTTAWVLASTLAAAGCVTPPPPAPIRAAAMRASAKPAPAPLSPFSDAPVSFLIKGQFVRGEAVVVRVCLRSDRSIASSDILESSGDRRFDELAINWARRVRLRSLPTNGTPVAPCGAVRVELRKTQEPVVVPRADDLLG